MEQQIIRERKMHAPAPCGIPLTPGGRSFYTSALSTDERVVEPAGAETLFKADQQIEAQREPPSLRGPKGRGNPVSRMDCRVASLLAMTIGLM
jgi:hypothetical protein